MSSHHIVRDKQEPALLLAHAEALPREWVEELLGWSPVVMVPFKALEEVVGWGIKIDVAVVPNGLEQEANELLAYQAPFRVITSDSALPEALLETTRILQHPACHLVMQWNDDSELLERLKPFLPHIQITVWKNQAKAFGQDRGRFDKWAVGKTSIRVVSDAPWRAEGNVHIDGNSVTYLSDGLCRFSFSGQVLLVEQLGG